jgi:hypothetical protein
MTTARRVCLIWATAAACTPDPGDADTSGSTGAEPPACIVPDQGLPDDVFCTGLYLDRDPTRIADEVMPYTPGVTLWSDGAEKHRYLYLPPATTIDTTDLDVWKFPVGTKAWKEFRVGGVLIETRIFWKRGESDWASGTYIWDEAGGARLDTSKEPILLADGYEIPTAKDCGKCHHGGADKLLGVEAVALALPTAQGATLSQLAADGRLSAPPPRTTIELPTDSTGRAGAALGYLHANCGMPCHSTRGLGDETELVLRLRAGEFWPADAGADPPPVAAAQTDAYIATVNVMPTTASVAQRFPDAQRITPGAHDTSLVWLMSHRRDDYAMPPLVSHKVDEPGTQALADWIDALP